MTPERTPNQPGLAYCVDNRNYLSNANFTVSGFKLGVYIPFYKSIKNKNHKSIYELNSHSLYIYETSCIKHLVGPLRLRAESRELLRLWQKYDSN